MLFIPGIDPYEVCSLCDTPAKYIATLKILVFDALNEKNLMTEIHLVVCEQHSRIMDIQIDKTIKVDERKLIIIS